MRRTLTHFGPPLVAAALLADLGVSAAAPAPYLKRPPRPWTAADVAGGYELIYAGTAFRATLARSGYFTATWEGEPWEGRWSLGKDFVRVEEWPLERGCGLGPEDPLRWTFPLMRTRHGKPRRTRLPCTPAAARPGF
jgi:hypothetical protein